MSDHAGPTGPFDHAREVVRFTIGTLTAIPVRPPRSFGREVTVPGIVLAPLLVLPLGLLVAGTLYAGRELGLAPLATAFAAVAGLALASRAFHLDGLADTADALTASYDAERSLEVMQRGDVGPAGAATLVLTLGMQVAGMAWLSGAQHGPLLCGVLVCVARGAAAVMSLRGVPAARTTGLAATYVGTLPPVTVAAAWTAWTAAVVGAALLADLPWWRGLVCVAAALLVLAWLVRRAARRFGGVTGDVYGAGVETSLAAMLLLAT